MTTTAKNKTDTPITTSTTLKDLAFFGITSLKSAGNIYVYNQFEPVCVLCCGMQVLSLCSEDTRRLQMTRIDFNEFGLNMAKSMLNKRK